MFGAVSSNFLRKGWQQFSKTDMNFPSANRCGRESLGGYVATIRINQISPVLLTGQQRYRDIRESSTG
jgi:hypothetical protein